MENRKTDDPIFVIEEWDGYLKGLNGAIQRLEMNQPNRGIDGKCPPINLLQSAKVEAEGVLAL